MTSEEFKGFCERFYGCYGEDVDLEEGDKFEIRLKTGEVMEFSRDISFKFVPTNKKREISW